MDFINIEFKARCADAERVRRLLKERRAEHTGTDHQVDTYFLVPDGRLKLREGKLENALIFYRRPDLAGVKQSDVMLQKLPPGNALRELLSASLGVLATVEKTREIYFIENVKVHIDDVPGLGSFVEVEAIQCDPGMTAASLRQQAEEYLELFGIGPGDLCDISYSDMVLRRGDGA